MSKPVYPFLFCLGFEFLTSPQVGDWDIGNREKRNN